ncbi:alpha-1,2-fucosyltransferase [Mucilaginibacter sp. L196]|uniref:alpha-1,2-fucosyltransferase n=1 Tax=Mucilaginibacter sp. L196 TaxID=1641870 RepID=UPI00131B1D7F|nr:alpha-1,2-fucosyltransferase [Mucilaginibacter sp. L196]
MDVVIIFNGLGNQMSQYALYLQKKKNNSSTRFITIGKAHNGFELNKVFKIDYSVTPLKKALIFLFRILRIEKIKAISTPLKNLLKLFNCRIVGENFDYTFKEEYLLPSSGVTFYYGGWHSEKYFSGAKNEINKAFEFGTLTDDVNVNYINDIINSNSVSIHVRRGDYLNAENYNLFGDVCNKAYFQKAIDLIEKSVNNPRFFVFSNDFPWIKDNLTMKNVAYVDCNVKENSWKDMYMMTLCKHNIISNSSFSWWGAWLNKNPDKLVISPTRFLRNDISTDIYPDSWIKLSDY